MKKRYLIPAVATASLAGLFFYGNSIIQENIASCNAGDLTACKDLVSAKHVHDQITTPGFQEFVAEAEAEAAAKKDTFHVNRNSVAMLALDCETKHIRPFLKDPNSFRELNHTYKETVDRIYVQVNYTATNGFGGRVQGSKVCNYTL